MNYISLIILVLLEKLEPNLRINLSKHSGVTESIQASKFTLVSHFFTPIVALL